MPNVCMYGIIGLHEEVSLRRGREGGKGLRPENLFLWAGGIT
jgi:hypothetical protein